MQREEKWVPFLMATRAPPLALPQLRLHPAPIIHLTAQTRGCTACNLNCAAN